MSGAHSTESHGLATLTEYLRREGRQVLKSPRKTFDLLVDGVLAEVKCKTAPSSRLDFIGLTDGQRRALDNGESFVLFVVCNLGGPGDPEILEIPSDVLRTVEFKVESTHYIYGPKLRQLALGSDANKRVDPASVLPHRSVERKSKH